MNLLDRDIQPGEHSYRSTGLLVDPHLGDLGPVVERLERGFVENDLALLGEVLGACETVDETSREDVDQLDVRVADYEPPGRADGDRDLHGEREGDTRRRADLSDAIHRRLHRQGTRGSP